MRRKFLVLNPRSIEEFKSQLTIEDYWTFRIWKVSIIKSEMIPEGRTYVINESYLSSVFNLMGYDTYKELLV